MADDISEIRLFVAIAAAGSLSAAARSLRSSPAVMSRRLAALEARLGVRLIARTSRVFRLTDEGVRLHERCVGIVADLDEAEAEASSGAGSPRGLLRVGAPVQWGRRILAPAIGIFAERFPEVAVHLTLSDAGLDVLQDDLDIALTIGRPKAAGVVTRRVVEGRRLVCAAPSYFDEYGLPLKPDDLLSHNCIRLTRRLGVFDGWLFKDGASTRIIQVKGRLSTSSGEVMHDWALKGYGIALKAEWDISDDVVGGRLATCLVDHWCDTIAIHAAYASREHLPSRIRAFLEHLKQAL